MQEMYQGHSNVPKYTKCAYIQPFFIPSLSYQIQCFFPVANFHARGKIQKSARKSEKSARGKKYLNFASGTWKLSVARGKRKQNLPMKR